MYEPVSFCVPDLHSGRDWKNFWLKEGIRVTSSSNCKKRCKYPLSCLLLFFSLRRGGNYSVSCLKNHLPPSWMSVFNDAVQGRGNCHSCTQACVIWPQTTQGLLGITQKGKCQCMQDVSDIKLREREKKILLLSPRKETYFKLALNLIVNKTLVWSIIFLVLCFSKDCRLFGYINIFVLCSHM